jgi:hypothetical protein
MKNGSDSSVTTGQSNNSAIGFSLISPADESPGATVAPGDSSAGLVRLKPR